MEGGVIEDLLTLPPNLPVGRYNRVIHSIRIHDC